MLPRPASPIDRCVECEGVWLDKSELEKVQILHEQWQTSMSQDSEKWGPAMQKIRQDFEDEIDRAVSISRIGFVNMIARALF